MRLPKASLAPPTPNPKGLNTSQNRIAPCWKLKDWAVANTPATAIGAPSRPPRSNAGRILSISRLTHRFDFHPFHVSGTQLIKEGKPQPALASQSDQNASLIRLVEPQATLSTAPASG